MNRAIPVLPFDVLAVLVSTAAGGMAAESYRSELYDLRLVTVADRLVHPWGLAFLPDGRMIVTERPGRIRIVARDGRLSPPLNGAPEVYASGQGGLLDIALDPSFRQTGVIFICPEFTAPDITAPDFSPDITVSKARTSGTPGRRLRLVSSSLASPRMCR